MFWPSCYQRYLSMQLSIAGIEILLVYKKVKHLYLRVCAQDASVSVTVPRRMLLADVRVWLEARVPWIRRQQAAIVARQLPRFQRFETGERAQYLGVPLSLFVLDQSPSGVRLVEAGAGFNLLLSVKRSATAATRARLVERWFREQLCQHVQRLVDQWQPIVGRPLAGWSIRKMRSRWGSCHLGEQKITLNLALVHYPLSCIECVVVHELVHLLEPSHNARFKALMGHFLPDFRVAEQVLNGFS